ncbi:hypothetical protein [Chromohalobacter israelensis]|uniref:hypothetical protein n=1 Tax=Chromohalobacter israelensis TaxID=141390 RepID=UPI000FFE8ABF|nr:hypothetical protein [Chromohalobacter salexigens]RXE48723.1 hypothetical protein B4O83_12390 [Chromohalobacter salexigens]
MIDQIAATKCRRRSSLTDDADHALRMAEDRAEVAGRRYGVFSAGPGMFRVGRVTGQPAGALEIVKPSWSYDAEYRSQALNSHRSLEVSHGG